jgi:YidC/Oxa1 family membrane protein insertase
MQMVDLYRHVYQFPPFDKLIPISRIIPIDNQFLWMDLSQPERIYVLGFGIPLLAIVVVVSTWLQSKLMTPPSQSGDQGAQMTQMMNLYMPIFMGYLAWTFAAGLSLYFVTSNIVTIVQYAAMGKVDWSNILPGKKPAPAIESKATVPSSSGVKAMKSPPKAAPVGKTSKPKLSKGKTAK